MILHTIWCVGMKRLWGEEKIENRRKGRGKNKRWRLSERGRGEQGDGERMGKGEEKNRE